MPLSNFTNLDFEQVKTTLREYLKENSSFTDYDFEGSNLSTILNVLAYNTYITSYNANMVANDFCNSPRMIIYERGDRAQRIVAHALTWLSPHGLFL